MIELNENNFERFATHFYTNTTCLTEDEFYSDLRQLSTVMRMMSKYLEYGEINVRLFVNNVLIFYNCFNFHAATKMLQYKIEEEHVPYFNAVLKYLSFPMMIPPENYDKEFYELINRELS